jgi:hypothetical protein
MHETPAHSRLAISAASFGDAAWVIAPWNLNA